jgi:DNA-binding transcriptional regulator YiaG
MLILSRQRVKSPDLLPGDLLGQFDEERMSERDMNLERGFPPLTAAEWAILLRHVRQHMHRSQFEAAELLNVGASTYKKWEEGKLVPRPYHRRQIRDILSDEIQTLASLGLLDSRLNIVRLRPVHEGAETETPLISGQRHNELSIVLSSDDPQALPALILTQELEGSTVGRSRTITNKAIDGVQTFIHSSLITSLLNLAYDEQICGMEKRLRIQQAIKKFDTMNAHNKSYQITRRDAICSLATLPVITLRLQPGKVVEPASYPATLAQCNTSLEACW